MTGGCFKRRHQGGDIADNECLARIGVKNLGRIDSAVAAGDDHDFRALAFLEFIPAVPLRRPLVGTETTISIEQV